MAFKKDFGDISITSVRPSIVTVAGTLRVWQAIDNTVTDLPFLTQRFEEQNCKTYVEGVTPQQLAQRVKEKLKEQVQGFITSYKSEQQKINMITPAFTTMVNSINTELTG